MVILIVRSSHMSITLSVDAKGIVMLCFMEKILSLKWEMIGDPLHWRKKISETMAQFRQNIPLKMSMAKKLLYWLPMHPLLLWGKLFYQNFTQFDFNSSSAWQLKCRYENMMRNTTMQTAFPPATTRQRFCGPEENQCVSTVAQHDPKDYHFEANMKIQYAYRDCVKANATQIYHTLYYKR